MRGGASIHILLVYSAADIPWEGRDTRKIAVALNVPVKRLFGKLERGKKVIKKAQATTNAIWGKIEHRTTIYK